MKRLVFAATLAAATALATASPAAAQQRYAQTSPEEARFFQAQERFDREYEAYQAEFERYRQWRETNRDWRGPGRPGPGGPGPGYRDDDDDRYSYDERDEGDYDPARYYRSGPSYQERVVRSDERVYRGRDGKYYCKRTDGTTGLIVGAGAGALLGNIIDGGRSRTAGTIIGALVGAAAGASVERNQQQLRCR